MSLFGQPCELAIANTLVPRTYGGLLMFFTGVLYLLFENAIIGNGSASRHSGNISSLGSRIIMGMQVGMVLLALIVTRSTVASLKAREGLPFGNQVIGWFVLGKFHASPWPLRPVLYHHAD